MTEKITLTQEQAEEVKGFSAEYGYTPLGFHRAFHGQTRFGDSFKPAISQSIQATTKMGEQNEFGILQKLYAGDYEIEPEYKVGDWVVYDGLDSYPAVKISAIQYLYERVRFDHVSNWRKIRDIIRHATPEEIKVEKERQLWKSIGREVGDFWDGDIALDKFGKVLHMTEEMEAAYQMGDLSGFHPADSYISFEEVEPNATTHN